MANAGCSDGEEGENGSEKIELEISNRRDADSEEQDQKRVLDILAASSAYYQWLSLARIDRVRRNFLYIIDVTKRFSSPSEVRCASLIRHHTFGKG